MDMNKLHCLHREEKSVEEAQEKQLLMDHRSDCLTLLVYIFLLILSLLTIWLFKHRRFSGFHETGLSVIYGLIMGAIVRYTSNPEPRTVAHFSLDPSDNFSACENQLPPERLLLDMVMRQANRSLTNNSITYEYKFYQRIKKDAMSTVSMTDKLTFDPEVFFNLLLPPIIFCAGYSMKRKHFFHNFGAIFTYAFFGTIISAMAVGAICFGVTRLMPSLNGVLTLSECLLFGSIISATDPVTVLAIFNDLNVDVDLYALVFGESVLNDAVAIVLSKSIDDYGSVSTGAFDGFAILTCIGSFMAVFSGAFAIGVAIGCLTALLTKYTHIRDYPILETALFVLMSYSTFLAAEAAGSTGIVAVLFCGITQAHYTYNNLSPASKNWTKEFFELLNFLAENFVFAYIGVSTFTFRQHNWNVGFIFLALLSMVLSRALNIYPLSFLLNFGRSNKITFNKQNMLMFSGLRGAMAFSLAIRNTSSEIRRMFFSTTLIIVIATVVLCGGATSPMLHALKIPVGVDKDQEIDRLGQTSARDRCTERSGKSSLLYSPVQLEDQPYCDPADDHTSGQEGVEGNFDAPTLDSPAPPRRDKAFLVKKWSGFDAKFVKPLLTHNGPLLSESLPRCCLPLAEILTTTEQLTLATGHHRFDGDSGLVGGGRGSHRDPWGGGSSVLEGGQSTPPQAVRQDDDLILAFDDAAINAVPINTRQSRNNDLMLRSHSPALMSGDTKELSSSAALRPTSLDLHGGVSNSAYAPSAV